MSSQILLLGATGKTGRLVLAEALERGHIVTALVRKANHSPGLPQHTNLHTVVGDPCSTADVETALRQCQRSSDLPITIISTLGQTRTSGNPFAATTSPPRFMEASVKAVLAASETYPVRKLVIMSMFGAGESFNNLNFLMRWIMTCPNMAQTLEDQNLVDAAVKASSNASSEALPYVLVRPAMLKDGDEAPVKVYEASGKGVGFMPSVTAKSVARVLVDMMGTDEYDGTTPVITN